MNVLVSIQQPVRAWQIPVAGVETLRRRFPDVTFVHATDSEERARGLAECDAAFTWILSAEEVAAAPRLRWVHSSAVAVETLALPDLFARGVVVSNSRGVQATPIAEHVLAVVLALAKQLPFALEGQRDRRWTQNDFVDGRLPWLLSGRTLALIGVGTIGSAVARRAKAFGMRTIAVRRRATSEPVPDIDDLRRFDALDSLLADADVLVMAAPLTPETHRLIGAPQLARMKRGALIINVGRAKIIDDVALADALRSGHLGGASLDVYHREPLPADDPFWTLPNVLLTPHTSGFRQGHWDEVIDLFSENLRRFQRGEAVAFRVIPELGY
jgi:phosphoglycerate dehydrogenase-like enzyme